MGNDSELPVTSWMLRTSMRLTQVLINIVIRDDKFIAKPLATIVVSGFGYTIYCSMHRINDFKKSKSFWWVRFLGPLVLLPAIRSFLLI